MEKFNGYYGDFGGAYVGEALKQNLEELEQAFYDYVDDPAFNEELHYYYKEYIGRENPLYFAENLTQKIGGAKIYLKREDLNHTGAHKINNAIGQALLAKRMGKKRIIAETGAGQHGVATATVCALFDMDCTVYMGAEDVKRQALNVFRMELLGAKVIPVSDGTQTLKDAVDAALEDFVINREDTFYMLGSAVGPHPYPMIVKTFQSIIGKEARAQILSKEGRLPDALVACVGGGSNAIGLFAPFYDDPSVEIHGVEPYGKGLNTTMHAASIALGEPAVLHGFKCYTLLDENQEIAPVYSVAAGLDYPGVGPEHCFYHASKRATYSGVTDVEALEAFKLLSRTEGIIPAIESAHAVAYGTSLAKKLGKDKIIIINLSGRGDKDVAQVKAMFEQ